MVVRIEFLEKSLPLPQRDLVGYASARTLEALLESLLALEFLNRGYVRNAAGKAFQAWKALLAALLALEKPRLDRLLKSEEERRWLLEVGIPRVPTSKLKALAQLLEEIGYKSITAYESLARDLHDYQHHGPDPTRENLSRHASPQEAAKDTRLLIQVVLELVEGKIKPKLEEKQAWSQEHNQALQTLKQKLR